MAKKIVGYIKLQIPAGKANPSHSYCFSFLLLTAGMVCLRG